MFSEHQPANPVLINREGKLRAGWVIVSFAILFIMLLSAGQIIGVLVVQSLWSPRLVYPPTLESSDNPILDVASFLLDRSIWLVAALAATAVCAIFIEKRSLSSVGFKLHKGWLRDFALGTLIGSLTFGLTVLVAATAGAIHLSTRDTGLGTAIFAALILFVQFLIAGAAEELLFRGVPFQALLRASGPRLALAATSGFFALVHLINPNAGVASTVNTVLAGVWLGCAYLMTRSLWLPTALHCSWNFTMAYCFGLPVSGITKFGKLSIVSGSPGEPAWISGGSYGPEEGLAATIAVTISIFVIWKSGLFKASAEMRDSLE